MGKRSNFEKIPQDKYNTPERATWPLVRETKPCRYAEPCAGKGDLIRHLAIDGFECVHASDIAPDNRKTPVRIQKCDALKLTADDVASADMIITNPPWTREILHPMIRHFIRLKPTFLLFDADWIHNEEAAELVMRCALIISIGRVQWFPGSEHAGKDNCCWYFFPQRHFSGPRVIPRNGG